MQHGKEVCNMSFDPTKLHLELLKNTPLTMRKRPEENLAEWQAKARARLTEFLGLPLIRTNENFRIEWVNEDDSGFTETRFTFASEPDTDVLCHLLIPKNTSEGKIPLVICLQGHSKGMHISMGRPKFDGDEQTIHGGDRDFAKQIVARGQAALVIEQRAFGERGGTAEGPVCHPVAMQALLLGRTLIGERCWDVSRAIDVVSTHFPEIDLKKIAIMGNSGGGTVSIYAAAVDTRITAVMPSCAFCGYLASIGALKHCVCNYIPGIAREFDMGDIAGLIAPRPLIIVNGLHDGIFPVDSAKEQAKIARRFYD